MTSKAKSNVAVKLLNHYFNFYIHRRTWKMFINDAPTRRQVESELFVGKIMKQLKLNTEEK